MTMVDQSDDSMEQQSFINSYPTMEKRQLFLRSYQFSRKRTISERIRRSVIRSKRVIWVRLRCARSLRKLVWKKLSKLQHSFFCHRRRYSRLFPLVNSNSHYHFHSSE